MSTVSLPSISGSRTSVRASVRRMLSANEIECNNLRSRYKELRRQITVVREENEVLRTQQLRMQAALSGFESGDNDVPHTMKKHSDELRTLREDVRLHNVKLRKAEQKLLKKVTMDFASVSMPLQLILG